MMNDRQSDISNDAMPLPAMFPIQASSEEASRRNASTTEVLDETSTSMENECSDEGTIPKRPCLGPGIVQPLGSGSSIYTEISPTHEQWAFNALLINLAKQINDTDLEQMKEMYKGGIPRGILKGIKTPMELFDVMRKQMFLSPMNLLQLQGLLWSIKKLELMNMVIDYARQSENIVYVQPASVTPVNGYTHIKFHLRGKQFGKMNRGELQYLRTIAANAVLIPSSFVIIDGINPSSSVIITLQFPEQHANIFRNLLEKREIELGELIEFGVDSITIGDKTFHINENPAENSRTFTDGDVDASIKLHWAETKIVNLEEENKKQSDKIYELDKQILTLQAQNDTFTTAFKTKQGIFSEDKKNPEELLFVANEIEGALTQFNTTLEDISKENCKRVTVLQLLQAHATLIASVCCQDVSMIFQHISTKAKQMQGLMIMTAVHAALQRFVGVDLSEESAPIKVLKEISMKLRPHEVQKLEEVNDLTESERNDIKSGASPVLLMLLRKELQKGFGLNLEEFLTKCLMTINRTELLQEFHEKFAKYAKDDINPSDGISATDTDEAKTSREPHINDIANNVKLILVKLSEMDQKINHLPEFGKLDSELKAYPHSLYKKFMEHSKSSW
ncbi:uncharacterized protein LOC132757561 [Ruditapes philippinarum]|uniref:uncharacterized protein LOC132757561 n=1 Tax=Ruditapes philippinarum TaxID=129788 RepID=UPI00295BE9B5|nr:uncharacterized protein LOC132757561 [Ruditapes philippinarum]